MPTPRPASPARTASRSSTTSWTPLTEPGSPSGRPSPITTEQAEPGGVICTTRMFPVGRTSWSRRKPARPSGRQAQAAHNDALILHAAREVFLADPVAPISAVAERAGVGIGALYHRYAGKEDLLRTLCRNGQRIYLAEVQRALSSG